MRRLGAYLFRRGRFVEAAQYEAVAQHRREVLRAEVDRYGGALTEDDPDAGVLPDLACLAGPGFNPATVHPMIHDCYTSTSRWRMEVWSSWSPLFWPGGELVSRLFGKRVQQLALPTRPLDAAHGMDGRVSVLTDREGAHVAARSRTYSLPVTPSSSAMSLS